MIYKKSLESKGIKKIVFFSLYSLISISLSANPMASKGILDLRQWDFSSQGYLELKGEWEFYWSEFKETDNFYDTQNPEESHYIQVPKSWNEQVINSKVLGPEGYGTYKLLVLISSDSQQLALKFNHIYSCYKLWVNGELLHKSGSVGKNQENEIPKFQNYLIDLGAQENQLEILIQVSNFHVFHGGIANPLFIGSSKQINNLDRNMNYLEVFLLGMFFIFAFYHIILFLLNKNDRAPLYFSILCILIALRLSVTGGNIMGFYFDNINFELQKKLEFIVITLAPFCFLFFIKTLIPKLYVKVIDTYLIIVLPLTTIGFFYAPLSFMYRILLFGQFNLVISILYFCYLMIRASRNKNHNALLLLIGNIGFFCAVIIDLIIFYTHIYHIYLSPMGLVFFFIIQSYILAKRNSNSYFRVIKLTESLKKYSNTLEKKVENRTRELKEQNQQRTNFFVNFSHEIKTPLTLIYNYLEQDINKRGLSSEMAIVERNLRQLKTDVCDYLDIEKMIAGKSIYNHGKIIDASFITWELTEFFQGIIDSKQIKLSVQIQNQIKIPIDPQAYIRIVRNLLDNAVAYSEKGAEVTIILKTEDKKCFLEVCDTGIGIPKNELENIFKSFYQITCNTQNSHGFGMGLSIIKMILQEIKGYIEVKSKIGLGSQFKVCFPLANEDSEANCTLNNKLLDKSLVTVSTNVEISSPGHQDDRECVMIVEDNNLMLQYLVDELGKEYNILFAYNGFHATEILDQTELIPDLILSDIMMDHMNGFEFFEAILTDEELKNIPFLFLTAKSTKSERLKAIKIGAIDYISKPFDIRELKAKISSLLKNRRAIKNYIKAQVMNKLSVFLDNQKDRNEERIVFELGLTSRETEVAQYLMKGLQNKEIAANLHLTESGVKKHVKNIYNKCGVHRKVDFLRYVHQKCG